jgi:hypothetical protein
MRRRDEAKRVARAHVVEEHLEDRRLARPVSTSRRPAAESARARRYVSTPVTRQCCAARKCKRTSALHRRESSAFVGCHLARPPSEEEGSMSGRDQSRKGSAGSKPCRKTASRRTGLSARDGYPSIVRERERKRERERERLTVQAGYLQPVAGREIRQRGGAARVVELRARRARPSVPGPSVTVGFGFVQRPDCLPDPLRRFRDTLRRVVRELGGEDERLSEMRAIRVTVEGSR